MALFRWRIIQIKSDDVNCFKRTPLATTRKLLPPVSGAPNGNFRENICSDDDLRSRIFGAFVVKFLACLPLLGFSNIYKMV